MTGQRAGRAAQKYPGRSVKFAGILGVAALAPLEGISTGKSVNGVSNAIDLNRAGNALEKSISGVSVFSS